MIDLIREALVLGKSNKRVHIERTLRGTKAVSYDRDLWLTVPTGQNQLLLVISSVSLEKEANASWEVTVVRNQRRKRPKDEDQLLAEEMIRRTIADYLKSVFPRQMVRVLTYYEGFDSATPLETRDPDTVQLAEADQFFQEIHDAFDGVKNLPSKTSRCEYCYWRKACPRAVLPEKSQVPSGRPTETLL